MKKDKLNTKAWLLKNYIELERKDKQGIEDLKKRYYEKLNPSKHLTDKELQFQIEKLQAMKMDIENDGCKMEKKSIEELRKLVYENDYVNFEKLIRN